MPTQMPLIKRPTISMPMFCEAQIRVDPITLHFNQHKVQQNKRDLPYRRSNHDCFLPSQDIRKKPRNQSPQKRAPGHGGGDSALHVRLRARAGFGGCGRAALVEIAFVLVCANDGRHGRDVEAEQATANDGDGRDQVDVSHGHCDLVKTKFGS